MATVDELVRKLAAEGSLPPAAPWLTRDQRETETEVLEQKRSWKPNRKVVSGLIAGLISWASLKYGGFELDPDTENGLTVLLMGFVSYMVPLSDG